MKLIKRYYLVKRLVKWSEFFGRKKNCYLASFVSALYIVSTEVIHHQSHWLFCPRSYIWNGHVSTNADILRNSPMNLPCLCMEEEGANPENSLALNSVMFLNLASRSLQKWTTYRKWFTSVFWTPHWLKPFVNSGINLRIFGQIRYVSSI